MFKNIYTLIFGLIGIFLLNPMESEAQVEFKVSMLPDSITYEVYFKPDVTWSFPFNITSSSQVTIKAPTGGFMVSNTTSLIPGVNWSHNATYDAPIEEPGFTYFSFGLTSLGTSDITYTAGVELPVFSFQNSGTCTGAVDLMVEGDPFTPPNSENGNVGNQLSTLGGGPGINVWSGNYDTGGPNCGGVETGTCDITSVSQSDASDCNASDGTITITASGSGPLEYSINNGLTWQSSNIFNVSAGDFDVVVRLQDVTCSISYGNNPVSIGEPAAPAIDNITVTQTSDCNTSDGSLVINASGGSGSLEYSLNGTDFFGGNTFTNLAAGAYTITVRNDDGTCPVTSETVTISAPSSPIIDGVTLSDPSACGVDDGSISITVSGGTGSFEYSLDGTTWSSNNTFNNLSGGTYSIFARNDNQTCEVMGADQTLVAPTSLNISVVSNDPMACGAADGNITITATGGTGNYEYSIDNGANWSTSNGFTGLAAGVYTIWARNDDGSCETAYSGNTLTLTEPACPGSCVVEYVLETLPDGRYQVSLIPNVTWDGVFATTSTAQVTVLAPTGGFQVSNLVNLIPNVNFSHNGTYPAPVENTLQDYFVFGLTSTGTLGISYQQGIKVPLFTFENGGTCPDGSLFLMENETDPFFPPNSENANVGQQLSTLGSGPDADICIDDSAVDCVTPYVNMECMIAYEIELLQGGIYQVSLISDTTWNFPQSITSTAQVTVVAPTGSLDIVNFTSLIPGADFDDNAVYETPLENPNSDYFIFGLISNGTTAITYEQGLKVPLFTFENGNECTGDSIHLMPIEGDPFDVPNSESANVGQQLTTIGSGLDANICIAGEAAPCVQCGPNLADTDGDGICDNEENMNGSDPLDPCDPDINAPNCDFECPEFFGMDYLLWDGSNGPAQVCVNVPLTDLQFFDIVVNQAPYTQPSISCSFDTLIFYSYAFTVGQGNTGPYELVSWEINGQLNENLGVAADMDEMAGLMNQADPNGDWENTANFAAISGGEMGTSYGDMIIKHVNSGVLTFIQENITFLSTGSLIEVAGVGTHEIIISDPNCADTLIVDIFDPQTDTIDIHFPTDSSYIDICLDTNELPGDSFTTTICDDPENGTATVSDDLCITYIPNFEYNGPDSICVVICSDTDPIFCDTSIIALTVEQIICEDLIPYDSTYLQGHDGSANICIPVALDQLVLHDIIVDQADYVLPVSPCEFDTLIFYTYAFTVGQGSDGPYEIMSWEVDGNLFNGIVQDMNELASMMNTWDPNGNWQNNGVFAAISGGNEGVNYGQMMLRHIASNVPTLIQANYTSVANSSELTLNGVGWHELILVHQQTGCADTVYVNIVEPEIDTIVEVLDPEDESIEICLDTSELPGNPNTISLCDLPENGLANTTDVNCVSYIPSDNFYGEDEFCVVICDDSPDEGPFCDTTILRIVIRPPNDELDLSISPTEDTDLCLDNNQLQFPGTPVSASICDEDVAAVDATIDGDFCLNLSPNPNFVGDTEVCIVHCFESELSGTEVCDTTTLNIFVVPRKDTIEIDIITFDPVETCLTDLIGLPGTLMSGFLCSGDGLGVDAEVIGLECLSLTPIPGFNGIEEICVLHCDDNDPAVCDTTIVLVNVDIPCPEVFEEDTVYTTDLSYCTPVSPLDIDIYDVVLNGVPYTFPLQSCNLDELVFYSYSFTFGSGNAGPYEVISWNVDGTLHSGVVQDMDELTAQMNQWDNNSNWVHEPNSFAISNASSTASYGVMVIKHMASNVETVMVPNYTSIAQGSLIPFSDYGLHEIVFIDNNTLCKDTIYVWSVDTQTDTLQTIIPFNETTEEFCLDLESMPDDINISVCQEPSNGDIVFTSFDCFQYVPENGYAGYDEICIVACSDKIDLDGNPLCDTTRVQIWVRPNTDQTSTILLFDETSTLCLDDYLEIDAPIASSGVCDENTDEVDVSTDVNSCINLDPANDFVGISNACVYHCYDLNGQEICDTTYVEIIVLPPTDTIDLTIEGFDPVEICLGDDILQLPGQLISASVCDENLSEVDANVQDECVTLDPVDEFVGTTEVCVVHCADTNPTICDTTIFLIEVLYPCEEIYEEDTILVSDEKLCVPIPLAQIGIYDIILNGQDYVLPPEPCDEDSLVFYTYSFTVGAGEDGPYDVVWDIDGTSHSTTIQDMDALTAWMNQIDEQGQWINDEQTKSISNSNTSGGYGLMIVTHSATDVPALLLPNFTSVAFGSCVYLDGAGLHELILANTQTGCIDTVYVWYYNIDIETIEIEIENATPTDDICLDISGLPGNTSSAILCAEPSNGTVDIDDTCFSYTPDGFYSGTEEFCIVVCDDTPAPMGPLCDTTYVVITINEPDCPPLFDNDLYTISEEAGTGIGNFCTPIAPEDFNLYDIILNNVPYTLPPNGCDVETLVFYSYSFTVGAGNSGPYEITSWMLNGSMQSATVQDMDDLVNLMNVWDPNGNWQNNPLTTSISGGDESSVYGNMVITHVGTQIPSVLLPNFTPIANGSSLELPVGTNELVFINNETGCVDEITVIVEATGNALLLTPKVFLQGPYDPATGIMNDNLRASGVLPLEEPYTDYNPLPGVFKYVHTGGGGGEMTTQTVLDITGDNAIVDWVFLELRSAMDGTETIATRSALLQKDGDIVDVDGVSPVSFDLPADDYYLVIQHRNHLGIMSAVPLSLSTTPTVIDFTDPLTATWGDHAQSINLFDGQVAMWAGDLNADGSVIFQGGNNDADAIFFEVLLAPDNSPPALNFILEGYNSSDTNLNGQSIYQGPGTDIDLIAFNVNLHPDNNPANINPNFVFSEQVP